MKKRFFAVLTVIAMMISMIIIPTYATESAAQTQAGYCQHCKQVIDADQWIPWDPSNTDPYSGHYYLTEDTSAQTSQITISLDDDLYRHTVCLDLRGHSYTVTGRRSFLIYGIFSVMDSVGGGEIAVTGYTTETNGYGTFCQMSKMSNSKDGSGELNLYSGTIRKINADGYTTAKGGLIYLYSQSTLNVYGGKLIGGKVTPRLTSSSNAIDFVGGGTVFANNGNINIYGGTVTGGEADNTPLTLSDGTTKTYKVFGGNIYAIGGSSVTISGGSIENGYSDTYGGNLCLRDSALEISGGTITGGYSGGAGGNIMLLDESTFKMSGGTLKNGVSGSNGGNLYVHNSAISIEITGGDIYGDLTVGRFKSFKLSGSPRIYMGLSNGLLLRYSTSAKMDISGLTDGAVIYLDGTDRVFTTVLENPEVYLTYFKDAIRADISVDSSGALRVDQGSDGFCPHCWQSGEQATWTVWHNNDNTSTSICYETGNTHYYLTEDCARAGIVSIGSKSVKTNDVVFDMAGKTWTTADTKVFNIRSKLSLVDSAGGGNITGTCYKDIAEGGYGGLIFGIGGAEFSLYSGTVKRTISDEENMGVLAGGIISMSAATSTNIYGGTVRDGISATVSSGLINCSGGNIRALGSFTMTAGALIGGKAYANSYILQDPDAPILVDGVNTTFLGLGGNLYVEGNTVISGGHIVDGIANHGGGIYAARSAVLTVSGCVIRNNIAGEAGGLLASDAVQTFRGGNLCIASSVDERQAQTLSDVILRSGSSVELGGNLYADYADLTLQDAAITDSFAGTDGGNVYLTGTVICDLYDGVIGNGVAGNNGGNLYGIDGAVFNLRSGLVCNGVATARYGGNLFCGGLNMYCGIVTGGSAASASGKGGNIYVPLSGYTLSIVDDGDGTTPAPLISNGSCGSGQGDNLYLGRGSMGILTGAIIRNGNIYAYNNKTDDPNYTKLVMTDCAVEGITADTSSGNGIYTMGALTLKGNTSITNEQNKSCVYIHGNGSLTVDVGFTGAASVAFADVHLEDVNAPQGTCLAGQNTAGGAFVGTLLLEGRGDLYDYSLPAIFAADGDSKLHIASTAVVDTTGEITWFKDAASAAAEAQTGEYLRLHATDNALTLSKDLVVDLNGNNLTVAGAGTVYGFDSSNDDYDGYGIVSITDPVNITVEPSFFANGNQYVTLYNGEDTVSFHRLGIRIGSVSLRPSVSGIYYKSVWECDDVLADKVDTFGIALSTAKMPDGSFADDTLYTTHTKDEFTSGATTTSVLVRDILKEGVDNQERGSAETIYAIPYICIDNGVTEKFTVVCDDNNGTPDGVARTLKDVMQAADRIWPKLSEKQQAAVKGMYDAYAATLETWELYNSTAAVNGTAAIRPLKILTLGHSLTVDSCHMLNLVAAAEGYSDYDGEFIIGTLYYSGCKLPQHVEFLTENSPVYSLYISSTKTPDAPPVITKGVTMEYGLTYDDWDIIIMQGGVFESGRESAYTNGNIQIIQNYVNAHKTNPNAILAWHLTWVPPTDNDLRDTFRTSPNSYYTSYAAWNDDRSTLYNAVTGHVRNYIVNDDNFIYLIPSGTAIENALSSYLTEKDLHRDYAHASDLGRVIAAYTWYCTLVNVDRLEEIKLDAIPMAFLKSTEDKTQDRVLTEAEKAIILEAVNNTIANPLEMTQSQYTEAPAE